MLSYTEISLDLAAHQLSDPPSVVPIEVDDIDDIGEFDPLPTPGTAANTDRADPPPVADDTIEIELTAEQMDAMLSALPIR